MLLLTIGLLLALFGADPVRGHGKIIQPPGRGTLWRVGYDAPVNYNDDENFCGGHTRQWTINKGKCGICGDAYDGKRDHEAGGYYFSGITAAYYHPGDVIDIVIYVRANHKGYFEFRLCDSKHDNETEVTQECLDKNLLKLAGDDSGTRYYIRDDSSPVNLRLKLKLPDDFECEHCVLQWHWLSANFWGLCDNGTGAVGCGPQETYRNCVDISIMRQRVGVPPVFSIPEEFLNNPNALMDKTWRLFDEDDSIEEIPPWQRLNPQALTYRENYIGIPHGGGP